MSKLIYLDNAATTKTAPEVLEAMLPYFTEQYGNPSAIYSFASHNKDVVAEQRERIANALGAKSNEIYFTAGGSESDNWALKATAEAYQNKGKHIITTKIEHHAILHTAAYLEERGFEVTYLDVDEYGKVNPADVEAAIRPDTILISVMYANNEIGTIQPVTEIGAICREKGVLFHTDAVQAAGHLHIDVKEQNIDMLSLSGHKLHAPKGVGALYIRPGLPLPPFIHGGGQEGNFRSGTENLPGICGFAAACAATDAQQEIARMTDLRDYCRARAQEIPGLVLIGQQAAPHIVNLSLPGLRSQGIINCLQTKQIYVSAGSACSKGHRSHVLEAMRLPPAVIDGSVRISFCGDNTREDVDRLIDALLEAKTTLKG